MQCILAESSDKAHFDDLVFICIIDIFLSYFICLPLSHICAFDPCCGWLEHFCILLREVTRIWKVCSSDLITSRLHVAAMGKRFSYPLGFKFISGSEVLNALQYTSCMNYSVKQYTVALMNINCVWYCGILPPPLSYLIRKHLKGKSRFKRLRGDKGSPVNQVRQEQRSAEEKRFLEVSVEEKTCRSDMPSLICIAQPVTHSLCFLDLSV